MSIPKVIHYCWFGHNPLPSSAEKCIESWKKYCPDYKIVRWDETNFDYTSHPYMCEAYEARKWAFVTDIARLVIIYENGGIYLDTDVELIKPIDFLLDYCGFMGFEKKEVATGLGIGAEKNNSIIKYLLDCYDNIHFKNIDGSLNQIACPHKNTEDLRKIGLICDGSYQIIEGFHFLPEDYLCPMDWETREISNMTENTVSIHHFDASWLSLEDKLVYKIIKPKGIIQRLYYFGILLHRNIIYLRNLRLKHEIIS